MLTHGNHEENGKEIQERQHCFKTIHVIRVLERKEKRTNGIAQ